MRTGELRHPAFRVRRYTGQAGVNFAESLKREGLSTKLAKETASLVVSTPEGGLLQARTRKIATPLKVAALALRRAIEFHTSAS